MNRSAITAVLMATLAMAGVLAAQEQSVSAAAGEAKPAVGEPAKTDAAKAELQSETVKANTDESAPGAQPGDLEVRIVRLSDVNGKVMMDRGVGHGLELTMQNMPIVQGVRLLTNDGFAEVEFEDGSTLRLAPDTEVQFPLLVLRSTGVKASTIQVNRGTVYVNTEKSKDNEFVLTTGKMHAAVNPGTHLRLVLNGPKAELAVFAGSVAVGDSQAPVVVGKKQTLTLDLVTSAEPEIARKVEEGPFDAWDKDALKYHERYNKGNSLLASNTYGVSDLYYYGSFVNTGCGSMWQPYFVSASWSPYSNGLWALYPGGGYSWVSPYPWGWLPYHTGSWAYCPTGGWGWQPGGQWYGLQNVMLTAGHPDKLVRGTVAARPPRRPTTVAQSMVLVNKTPIVKSKMDGGDRFVFTRDSAGLGVPRGQLGNLHHLSNQVEHQGFASREVYAAPVMSQHSLTEGRSVAMPLALHRGTTPEGMAWKLAPVSPQSPNAQSPQNAQHTGGGVQATAPNHPSGGNASAFHGGGNAGNFHSGGASAGGGGSFHGGGGGGSTGGGGSSHGGGGSSSGSSSGGSSSGGASHH